MKPVLGILSSFVVVGGTFPYLRDVFKGETKPARSTWLLLTVLMLVSIFLQHDIGAGWAIALTAGELTATGSVFLSSLKFGKGGLEKVDIVSYVLWGIMVVCWLKFKNPLLAIHFGILADFVSLLPTYLKCWKMPHEESSNIFIGGIIAGSLGTLAAQTYDYKNIVLPVYLLLSNASVVLLLKLAHKRTVSSKRTGAHE